MIEAVSVERWRQAQEAEIAVVSYDYDGSRRAAQHILDYLGIAEDRGGQTIVEVGCGPYPATSFVVNVEPIVIEPLRFPQLYKMAGAQWITEPFEDAQIDTADEVWLFNALQHVRDPELVVSKAKETAPTVRFFEPIDYPTCVYHPHTFTESDFVRWFGGSVKRYRGGTVAGFHESDCAYGTWMLKTSVF